MRYTVEFFFFYKYDTSKKHPWCGKCGIILNIRNNINIPDGNNGSVIRGIMKELLLTKADGVKFEPDLKGRSKTGRKYIIDMDSQEV